MPRHFKSLRLWAVVSVLCLSGIMAMALGTEGSKPQPQRAWPHSAAL